MDKNIAIEFNNVGKQYRLGLVGTGSLQHDLNRWWQTTILRKEDPYLKIGEVNDRSTKGNSDYVWALKDISFKVEQGDVVGIIGKNGAGKSTLLKLLSHITAPSTGTIDYRGRIASLLEVGTGFHPEMTARQNIYMNGSIMGMTKHEIDKKLDEIVDFAGIERYLDTPVKRFSSGMTVRLGFAVAAFLEPEILVVDEVLAVGDAEFQKKAIGKMKDVSSAGGRTVLFVSHNMGAVRNLCNNAIVLKNGMVDHIGTAVDCVDYYISNNIKGSLNRWQEGDECDNIKLRSNEARIISIGFVNNVNTFNTIDEIPFVLQVKANEDIQNCRINLTISKADDTHIGTVLNTQYFSIKKGEERYVRLSIFNHNLAIGEYYASFSIGVGSFNEGFRDFQIIHKTVSFLIDKYSDVKGQGYVKWDHSWGPLFLPHKLQIINKS